MAPGLGFEPRLTGPEPAVLPLDDPGISIRQSLSNAPNYTLKHVEYLGFLV